MKITIIGTGYVGLVTGTCFAELGNKVTCVDNNKKKIADLKKLIMPIYEPGLEDLVRRNVKEGRLLFTSSIKQAVKESEIIFICVSTPPKDDGEADLTSVENVARSIALNMSSYCLIVDKSTVPVETGEWVKHTIKVNLKDRGKKNLKFDVASSPEFLREGQAIYDFMHPDRIVIGVETKRAEELLSKLYKPFKVPIVVTDIKSAELIKHASNSFLAMKISFINVVSRLCEKVGADITKVARGVGLDKRIGKSFLDAGIGYGGSCFPKDVDAFIKIAEKHGCDLSILTETRRINSDQVRLFIKKIEDSLWIVKDKVIGVLGLSFKPGTDDLRNAASLKIIERLLSEGACIKTFDPQAMPKAGEIIKSSRLKFSKGVYDVAKGCDCLVIVTEWDEFKAMDLERIKKIMKQPLIIDGRNIFDPEYMKKIGIKYLSIGR
ncbi:MAG TPA: UDP-glucose/GDP-mannose dehydrogenase family protein [Candidatus Omnitrophica bacterium]|nr:UDP-glucose/GDP-mannose dehydrogenase family protein [Candidatus Omnitrophota bacterium]